MRSREIAEEPEPAAWQNCAAEILLSTMPLLRILSAICDSCGATLDVKGPADCGWVSIAPLTVVRKTFICETPKAKLIALCPKCWHAPHDTISGTHPKEKDIATS